MDAGGSPVQPALPYTVQIWYSALDLGRVQEETLGLYCWQGGIWQLEGSSALDLAAQTVTAQPDHLSMWAVLGILRQERLLRFHPPLIVSKTTRCADVLSLSTGKGRPSFRIGRGTWNAYTVPRCS